MSALASKLSKGSSTQLAPSYPSLSQMATGDLLVVLLGWVLWGNWLGPYPPLPLNLVYLPASVRSS